MNVGLISLGCSKNQVDSELILGVLQQAGIQITNTIEEADAIIVNTCGFIEAAKEETISTIQEMVETGKKLIVCGCYAQRYPEELKQHFPQIDRIIGLQDYPKIDKILAETFQDQTLKFGPMSYFNRVLTTSQKSPYIKLSEGCNNRCTYCAIPLIRGDFISRPMDEIVAECKGLIASGARELNLISQDTTRYGSDFSSEKKSLLPNLLAKVSELDSQVLVRVLYLYPSDITDELLHLIQSRPNIAPYFDVPIQHVSSNVLRRMARRGRKEDYISLFTKIRTLMPQAVLRTTLIVGFPGETEDDFGELCQFIQDYPFERLGAFAYSKESDTPAFDFDDQVLSEIKEERLEKIMTIQQKVARKLNKRFVNSSQLTLIEQYDEASKYYYGRSYAFAPDDIDGMIVFQSVKPLHIGDVVPVRIKAILGSDWIGDAE